MLLTNFITGDITATTDEEVPELKVKLLITTKSQQNVHS